MSNIGTSDSELRNTKRGRLSAPRQGVSLESVTEIRAVHIRKVVSLLAGGLDKSNALESFNTLFAPRWEIAPGLKTDEHSLFTRAAWNLICVWLLARSSGDIKDDAGFAECEEWFLGNIPLHVPCLSSLIPPEILAQAKSVLLNVSVDRDFGQDFWDLFPYILQEVGPGSRSSVLRDPRNRAARVVKKRHGVFYTPSDVAGYMAKDVIANCPVDIEHARCFDPACGTGVFLLALCHEAEERSNCTSFNRFEYVITNLFGCDISAHAVDACTFVLLQHSLSDIKKRGLSPWSAWHAIRLNIANLDSLTLNAGGSHFDINSTLREEQKRALLSSDHWVVPEKQLLKNDRQENPCHSLFTDQRMIEIAELFPEAREGFHILVGNPPYSKIGHRADYDLLSKEYHSFSNGRVRPDDNIFLLFVEMMWRLTVCGQSSSALVTPLSIAYNSGARFIDCRRAMSQHGGRWKFAFFDREPHALFGEEVKTRNAILFRIENSNTPQRGQSAIIETGAMRKWTSRTRGELFNSIHFTSLDALYIADGIPKLEGDLQSLVFNILKKTPGRFESFCWKIGKCNIEDALKPERSHLVYAGGTAYNFLNVFRKFSVDINGQKPLSETPVHCLEFMTEDDASAAFAILNSRIVFWLWHAQSDGFHVPGWFIRDIPFHPENIPKEQMNSLSTLGACLWSKVQYHRFSSINGGKLTYTFRPLSCNEERDEIDAILISAAGLPSEMAFELNKFVQKIVVVDESDNKREHLKTYFTGGMKACLKD